MKRNPQKRDLFIMARLTTFLTAFAFLTLAALPGQAKAADIYETLKADPQFSILVQIIEGADLEWRYQDERPRTVFAPVNAAFESIPGGYEDMLPPLNPSTKENVSALLLYQIVPGRVRPETLTGQVTSMTTFQRGKVMIDGTKDPLRYGGRFGGNVAGPSQEASNGLIVPLDAMPIPQFEEVTPPKLDAPEAQ